MARKFFAEVMIGVGVRNMPTVEFDADYLAHRPDPAWPMGHMERCVCELRARCFQCKSAYAIHFSAVDLTSWKLMHRDDWAYVYFKDEAGWDIENGRCAECIYAAMARN